MQSEKCVEHQLMAPFYIMACRSPPKTFSSAYCPFLRCERAPFAYSIPQSELKEGHLRTLSALSKKVSTITPLCVSTNALKPVAQMETVDIKLTLRKSYVSCVPLWKFLMYCVHHIFLFFFFFDHCANQPHILLRQVDSFLMCPYCVHIISSHI